MQVKNKERERDGWGKQLTGLRQNTIQAGALG